MPKRHLLKVEMEETIVGKGTNNVETASPKEKQGPVAEKTPTVGQLTHSSEDKDKRKLYTIRKVNTLCQQAMDDPLRSTPQSCIFHSCIFSCGS